MRRPLVLAVAVVVAAALTPASALATVHIRRGQTVTDVRVVGDQVRVDGVVRGHVIVVDGGLTIGRGGVVNGATLLFGHVRTEPGGILKGDVFQVGGAWRPLSAWRTFALLGLFLVFRVVFVWLISSGARLLASQGPLDRVARAATERPLRTIGVGVLAALGVGASSLLLAISLVGLVVSVALAGLLVGAGCVGLGLGLRASSNDFAVALRLCRLWLFVPIFGEGLFAFATVIGLGSLLRLAAEPSASAHFAGVR